jgi:hypothetical protein
MIVLLLCTIAIMMATATPGTQWYSVIAAGIAGGSIMSIAMDFLGSAPLRYIIASLILGVAYIVVTNIVAALIMSLV